MRRVERGRAEIQIQMEKKTMEILALGGSMSSTTFEPSCKLTQIGLRIYQGDLIKS